MTRAAVPLGEFRPITLRLTCDAGGLFCAPFEREGDYVKSRAAATAQGWLESGGRFWCPSCVGSRRA